MGAPPAASSRHARSFSSLPGATSMPSRRRLRKAATIARSRAGSLAVLPTIIKRPASRRRDSAACTMLA